MNPRRAARHGLTLAWRSLLKLEHSPDQLLDVLLMPITFVLVFVFLFGKAVAGDWREYLQFVLPGIAVQALMFASMGTALALNSDLRTGIFDRFRSLPIARSAPLTGHVLGDLVKQVVSLALVFGFGAVLGFRPHGGPLGVLAGCGLIMLFSLAVCWIAALVGMVARTPGSVQGFAFMLIFPLTFGSNVFVPTASLPGWLQAWVRINPVTQVSDAVRGLMLDLPLGRSLTASLLWTAGIIVVFAPLAVGAYRRQA
ncbi:MAG TPA: ABC transporter permease [Actinomycetota bacterium]|nr:ABC transporter permease [Actinomycetota bacterium]